MLNWSSLDPSRFERAVQMLLRRLHPDLVSIDGAGGDDGRDAERPLTSWTGGDGTEAFEIKSHTGRLRSSARRQVAQSLTTAVRKLPTMRRWALIVGVNPTPAELRWFDEKLRPLAPGVDLRWCGQDWLDGHMAENRDLVRYIEGPESELLRAAREHGLEREVLAGGLPDLAARTVALQGRVDDISPNWTLDTTMGASGSTFTLRAKRPDAATIDPIIGRPKVDFSGSDEATTTAREQFELALRFGGVAELDETHFKGMEIDASDEVKQLLGSMEAPGRLKVGREPQRFDKPFRARLEARVGGLLGPVTAALEVSFTTYTNGALGGQIYGSDAAGTVKVTMRLPRPSPDGDPRTVEDGALNVSFEPIWDFAMSDVLAALQLRAAIAKGAQLHVTSSWARFTLQPGVMKFKDARELVMLARAATVLVRLEELLGLSLRLPRAFSVHEVKMAEAAALALEGTRAPLPGTTLSVEVRVGPVTEALKKSGGEPTEVRLTLGDHVLNVGDLAIPYGAYGVLVPKGVVANLKEVLAAGEGESVRMCLEAVGDPIALLSRSEAEADLAKRMGQPTG